MKSLLFQSHYQRKFNYSIKGFLKLKPEDVENKIAKLIPFIEHSRAPDSTSLAQVETIYTGKIHYVNMAKVKEFI